MTLIRTVPHGHLQGGAQYLLLFDSIQSVYFSAIADTINWLKIQPIDLPWLPKLPSHSRTGILKTFLTPGQPAATNWLLNSNWVPSLSHNNLGIIQQNKISHWHTSLVLYPRLETRSLYWAVWAYEVTTVTAQAVPNLSVSSELAAKIHAIGTTPAYTKTIYTQSEFLKHNLTAFTHMLLRAQQSCLHKMILLSIILLNTFPCNPIYLKAMHSTYAQSDIWSNAYLNKSSHAAETRKITHTLLAQELTKIAKRVFSPYDLQWITPTTGY